MFLFSVGLGDVVWGLWWPPTVGWYYVGAVGSCLHSTMSCLSLFPTLTAYIRFLLHWQLHWSHTHIRIHAGTHTRTYRVSRMIAESWLRHCSIEARYNMCCSSIYCINAAGGPHEIGQVCIRTNAGFQVITCGCTTHLAKLLTHAITTVWHHI